AQMTATKNADMPRRASITNSGRNRRGDRRIISNNPTNHVEGIASVNVLVTTVVTYRGGCESSTNGVSTTDHNNATTNPNSSREPSTAASRSPPNIARAPRMPTIAAKTTTAAPVVATANAAKCSTSAFAPN